MLVVAVAAAGVLLALPGTDRVARTEPTTQAQPAPSPNLTRKWPDAKIGTTPAKLADASVYTPWFFLDDQLSLGTATTPDGAQMRLLLHGAGEPREIRKLSMDQHPQFVGFTAAADSVFWFEFTATDDGAGETRVWKLDWRTTRPPAVLTADTGAAVFFNSEYDLVVGDGRLHWISVAQGGDPVTEVRSIPVTGGKVSTRKVPGMYALSAWPWLASAAGTEQPMELVNLATGQKVKVPTAASELIGCSPVWCRSVVLGPDGGATRIDVLRPDGANRQRVAGGGVSAAISDVALVDRFEVLTQGRDRQDGVAQLALFDLRDGVTSVVADGIGMVSARGGVLWWSTGDAEPDRWFALDLRKLA